MDQAELETVVKDFEEVLKASERLRVKGTRIAVILGTFFAMWCSLKVRKSVAASGQEPVKEPIEGAVDTSQFEENSVLPKPDTVHSAGEKLIAAVASGDFGGAARRLAEMGVTDLCPRISEQLTLMEAVARSMPERAQLIPLVELSLFAVDVGELDGAAKYVAEARRFDPAAYELYCLLRCGGPNRSECGARPRGNSIFAAINWSVPK